MFFFEPFTSGMKIYEEMQKFWVDYMQSMFKDPTFLLNLGAGINSSLDGRKELKAFSKQCLESVNMPTRDDTARILQYLQGIESRIIGLEEHMEDMEDALKETQKGLPPVETQKGLPPVEKKMAPPTVEAGIEHATIAPKKEPATIAPKKETAPAVAKKAPAPGGSKKTATKAKKSQPGKSRRGA